MAMAETNKGKALERLANVASGKKKARQPVPDIVKEAAKGPVQSRGEKRIDKILKLPVPLSYPFYVASLVFIFLGTFIFLNAGIVFLMEHAGLTRAGFITIAPKLAWSGIQDIRWTYYIPIHAMAHLQKLAVLLALTGLVMLGLRRYVFNAFIEGAEARKRGGK